MSVGAIRAGRAMVEIFADSSMLARGLSSARSQLARFAITMRRLGTTQVVLGVGMAAPIALAVKKYAELEQRINNVRALSGASAAQMRGIQQSIMRIGMATGRPFNDIADGMTELVKAGVQTKELAAATKVIADFSQAAGIDMASGAKIGIQVLNEFGLGMEHLSRVSDVLQEMANATVSSVEDLGDGFRYAGQTAKLFGLSLEQSASAIAFLQQSGLSASTAGTAFNQLLLQTIDNLDAIEGAIGGLRNANGDFLPFEKILEKLQAHLAGMDRVSRLKFLNDMFDVRGMRGAAALLENIEGWISLNEKAKGSAGASAKKAREMQGAFVVAFEKMTNGVHAFAFAIGEVLDKDLRETFSFLANAASGLAPFVKANEDAVRGVVKFAAAITASGVAFFGAGIAIQLVAFSLEGFSKILGAVLLPLKGVSAAVSGISRAFTVTALRIGGALSSIARQAVRVAALLTLPVRFAAAQMANAVYMLVLASTHMWEVVGLFAQAAGMIATIGIAAAGSFGSIAVVVGAAAVAAVVLREAFERIVPTVKAIAVGVSKSFGDLAARAVAVWPEIVQSARIGWRGVVDAVQAGDLSRAWRVFASTAKAIFAQIMVVIGPWVDEVVMLAEQVGEAFAKAFHAIVGVVADVFNEIKLIAGPVIRWLGGLGDWILDGLAQAFPGIASLFSFLADTADATGSRILEALSAGDIVKAWVIASSAISQMFVRIGGAYERYVGNPIKQIAAQMAETPQVQALRDASTFEGTSEHITAINGARTPEQLADAQAAAAAHRAGLEQRARQGDARAAADLRLLDEATRIVINRFKQLGTVTEAEARRREDEEIGRIAADAEQRMGDINERRKKNAADRRWEADQAAAEAASQSGLATTARKRKSLRERIAAATSQEELDALQDEHNDAVSRGERSQRNFGDTLHEEGSAMADPFRNQSEMASARSQLESLDSRAEQHGIGDADKKRYRGVLEQFLNDLAAAETNADIERARQRREQGMADVTESRGPGAVSPEGNSAALHASLADSFGEQAGASQQMNDRARDESDEFARAEAAGDRREAAKARRSGDNEAADQLEAAAAALEESSSEVDNAETQRMLNEQRQQLQREQQLRDQRMVDGREAAAGSAKPLDTVGTFMSSALDRLGFGKSLAEQQAKDTKRAADGIDQLVQMQRDGGGGIFA